MLRLLAWCLLAAMASVAGRAGPPPLAFGGAEDGRGPPPAGAAAAALKTDDQNVGDGAAAAAKSKPAVLFCSPSGPDQVPSGDYVDLDYLTNLHALGYQVDYTSTLADGNATRLRQYNVLVVFDTVAAAGLTDALVEAFVADGGGVLMLPQMTLYNLADAFGAKIPAELMVESNESNAGVLSHMPYPLWHTSNIPPSPVSDGVHGLWYPSDPAYNSQMTNCLDLPEPEWTVVVRAMSTVNTTKVQHADGTWPFSPAPIDPFVRNHSVHEPPIMGIREVGSSGGRVGILAMYNQFLFGSGTKWLFNNEVLSTGIDGRPSDVGTLLHNTLAWLAEPSLQNSSSTLGGFMTTPDTLLYPNDRPSFVKQLKQVPHYHYDKSRLADDPAKAFGNQTVHTGLIGAVTTLGGGSSTVQEYAVAAAAAGLSFVAFLDPFTSLTNESFADLKQQCKQHSTATLQLYAGFTIDTNIGDRKCKRS